MRACARLRRQGRRTRTHAGAWGRGGTRHVNTAISLRARSTTRRACPPISVFSVPCSHACPPAVACLRVPLPTPPALHVRSPQQRSGALPLAHAALVRAVHRGVVVAVCGLASKQEARRRHGWVRRCVSACRRWRVSSRAWNTDAPRNGVSQCHISREPEERRQQHGTGGCRGATAYPSPCSTLEASRASSRSYAWRSSKPGSCAQRKW